MMVLLAGFLLQSADALTDERIEVRTAAAARFEALGRDFEDAVALWTACDSPPRLRLSRIREAWRTALGDLLPPPEEGPFPDEDLEVIQKLKTCRLKMDMERAPLTAVVDYLREVTGLNMLISGLENPDSLLLTFRSEEEEAGTLLCRLLRRHNLTHLVRDGVVLITTAELRRKVKLELYDVQHLQEKGEELILRIARCVHPGKWNADEGRSIQFQNGLLIVRTSIEGHRAVREFLRRMTEGEPEAAPRTPAAALAEDFRSLTDDAELRIIRKGLDLAEGLKELARMEGSPDLNARLHARELLKSLKAVLAADGARRLLERDELGSAIREFRSAWLADGTLDDFPLMVARQFGSHAKEARLAVVEKLTRNAAVIVREGRAVAATPEEWLSPKPGTLIFTLGEGPACVVVELAR